MNIYSITFASCLLVASTVIASVDGDSFSVTTTEARRLGGFFPGGVIPRGTTGTMTVDELPESTIYNFRLEVPKKVTGAAGGPSIEEVDDDEVVVVRSPRRPITFGHEAEYRKFLSGVLIYDPGKLFGRGKIKMPIRALANPLDGTFDLSGCGDTGKYISIHTGYKKAKIAANAGKIEIWFTPKFLVEANLGGDAAWLRGIMDKWTHPWGMFWTWGGWDCNVDYFDYLLRSDVLEDKSKNCYEKFRMHTQHRSYSRCTPDHVRMLPSEALHSTRSEFYFLKFD